MSRRSSCCRPGQGPYAALRGRAGEVTEPAGELDARLPLPGGQPGGDLAHREQRRGGRGALFHHLRRERPEPVLLPPRVLGPAEAVLQPLPIPSPPPVRRPVVHTPRESPPGAP